MRYTAENVDVREVAAGELWIGVIPQPVPHVVICTRDSHDDAVNVSRFRPHEARQMGEELIRLALTVDAPNN